LSVTLKTSIFGPLFICVVLHFSQNISCQSSFTENACLHYNFD